VPLMPSTPRIERLWTLVRSVPRGKVVSYGALGRAVVPPVSGLVVGHWMANCDADVPWWRVVGAKGNLPVFKRDASFAIAQETRLREEGVEFVDGLVSQSHFITLDD
ncbi:MAG: MGMT family protein, partial [Armatimonadota bacterium]